MVAIVARPVSFALGGVIHRSVEALRVGRLAQAGLLPRFLVAPYFAANLGVVHRLLRVGVCAGQDLAGWG